MNDCRKNSSHHAPRDEARKLRRLTALCLLASCLPIVVGCGAAPSSPGTASTSYVDQAARAGEEPIPEVRARKLIQIAYKQVQAKDDFGAEDTFELADKACDLIEEPSMRAGVLTLLCQARMKLDDDRSTLKSLAAAQKAVEGIEDLETKALATAKLAQVQARLDDPAAALRMLQSAEELAAGLENADGQADAFGQTRVLSAVAESYHQMGQAAEAGRTVEAALKAAESLDGLRRCEATGIVAATQHKMGEKDAAEATFARALEFAAEIDTLHQKANAMCEMAEQLAECGHRVKARETLEQADQVAHRIPELDLQRQTVERIRTLMRTLGSP